MAVPLWFRSDQGSVGVGQRSGEGRAVLLEDGGTRCRRVVVAPLADDTYEPVEAAVELRAGRGSGSTSSASIHAVRLRRDPGIASSTSQRWRCSLSLGAASRGQSARLPRPGSVDARSAGPIDRCHGRRCQGRDDPSPVRHLGHLNGPFGAATRPPRQESTPRLRPWSTRVQTARNGLDRGRRVLTGDSGRARMRSPATSPTIDSHRQPGGPR